ncbi:MAG: hypothetical protein AB7O97_04785 [Planctomycetota bacterium]
MRPKHPLLVLLLLSLLPAATCGGSYRLAPSAQRTLLPAIELPKGLRALEVQFHDGLLTVEAGTAPECLLEIQLLAEDQEGVDELAAAVAPEVQVSADGTRASLSVALPNGADLDAVRTNWRVQVPATVAVRAVTRRGAVVARDLQGDLDVEGGSGIVEADMRGGTPRLSTSSGSLILRGDYPFAELVTRLGRVDVRLPEMRPAPVELLAQTGKGDVYIDVCPDQVYDLFFRGDRRLVQCDPEVRVQWVQNVDLDGEDHVQGRLGDLHGQASGMVRLASEGPVYVRLRPEAVARSRPAAPRDDTAAHAPAGH